MVALLGGLIALVGFIPYNFAAIRGRTKPNFITWMVMAFTGFTTSFVIRTIGGAWPPPAAFTVGRTATCCVAVWALFKYEKFALPTGIEALAFGVFGFLSIFYGLLLGLSWENIELGDLKFSLIMTILIELFGMLPTLESSWKNPKDENLFGWTCFLAGSAISLSQAECMFCWDTLYLVWAALVSACPIILILLGRRSAD